MRYLITGGSGFIGSHLAESLLKEKTEVYIIDDLSTGSIENIEHLKDNKHFHYVVNSIMNVPVLAELIDKCDTIFHLAAAVGVKLIVESPVRTIATNIKGTEIVLDLANKKKKKVIIASTSEVYGKAEKIPFNEEDDLVLGSTKKGRWSYACSKAIDEFLALAYWKEKQLPVVVLRFFNTVGPRQTGQYGMVIPTFVKQALLGHPITIYGDGKQSRSFTYISDVVDATIKLAKLPKAVGEVFNIGNGAEITIEELAKKIKEVTLSNSEIIYLPYSEAYEEGFEDMKRRVPDIKKLKDFIGYNPTVQLDQMLENIINHFKK
ncbi:MAG: GDP-mannose 4,6-dehydratase [bacterium]